MSWLAERLRLFEPLLDELAAEFGLEATGPEESRGDAVYDAYHRCEVKRHRIGEASASNREAVLDHASEIMHAIAHDHCPSGNRQLIEPMVNALGERQVMERILGYMETGAAGGSDGVVLGRPDGAVRNARRAPGRSRAAFRSQGGTGSGERTPSGKNAEAHLFMQEFRPRIRAAYLRAFLASEDLGECRHFSRCVSLSLDDYPVELHPEVEAARRIAEQHPERFKPDNRGR